MYIIRGQTFKTWGAVQDEIKLLLYKGDRTLESSELEFVIEYLKHHPSFDKKIEGMLQLIVKTQKNYPRSKAYPGFYIVKADGVLLDISYLKCVSSKNKHNIFDKHLTAYRCEIETQIVNQKNSSFPACVQCGNPDDIQVDHVIDFVTLVNNFETVECVDINALIDIKDDLIFAGFRLFSDRVFADKWQIYHEKNATFQKLCKQCNLRKKKAPRYRK